MFVYWLLFFSQCPTWILLTGSTPILGLLVLMTDNTSQLPVTRENSPQPNSPLLAQEAKPTPTGQSSANGSRLGGTKGCLPHRLTPSPLHLFVVQPVFSQFRTPS